MTTYVEIHALQSVPPSNLNRDESGSPKSALYGGVQRARVSSQAWKRATRLAFTSQLDPADHGYRTKRVIELIVARILNKHPDLDPATLTENATHVLKEAGIAVKAPRVKTKETADPAKAVTPALVFLSGHQLDALCALAVSEAPVSAAAAKKAADTDHGVTVSLFGRMVASSPDLTVDAAVQVAHAISTHSVDPQADYYTAVDDFQRDGDHLGAGMVGTIEFSSSTLYRYAAINVDHLHANLENTDATASAAAAFVTAFLTSMPSGKLNTFANNSLPDAVLVTIGEGRPVSLVGAFEEPVPQSDGGYMRASVERLAAYLQDTHAAYGATTGRSWVIGIGDRVAPLDSAGDRTTLTDLTTQVHDTVNEALNDHAGDAKPPAHKATPTGDTQ